MSVLVTLARLEGRQLKDYAVKIRALRMLARGDRIECELCGCDELEVLVIDHVGGIGAGRRHRQQIGRGGHGSGMRLYRWILRHPDQTDQLRITCANCHMRLHWLERLRKAGVQYGPACVCDQCGDRQHFVEGLETA